MLARKKVGVLTFFSQRLQVVSQAIFSLSILYGTHWYFWIDNGTMRALSILSKIKIMKLQRPAGQYVKTALDLKSQLPNFDILIFSLKRKTSVRGSGV